MRSIFEPATFGFLDLPEQEAGALYSFSHTGLYEFVTSGSWSTHTHINSIYRVYIYIHICHIFVNLKILIYAYTVHLHVYLCGNVYIHICVHMCI